MSDEYRGNETNDGAETPDVDAPEASSRTNEVSAFEAGDSGETAASSVESDPPAPEKAESTTPAAVENKDSGEQAEAKDERESQSYVTIDGNRFRTDDNGDIHMYYDKASKDWKMMPNTEYESNGYKYKTDANGNIVHGEGTLRLSDGERKPLNDKVEGITEDDDRGHIIADRFEGSNHRDNLFPQLREDNRGAYKVMENELANAVADNKEVTMSVDLEYSEEGEKEHRPDKVTVNYTIDGEEFHRTFDNRRD